MPISCNWNRSLSWKPAALNILVNSFALHTCLRFQSSISGGGGCTIFSQPFPQILLYLSRQILIRPNSFIYFLSFSLIKLGFCSSNVPGSPVLQFGSPPLYVYLKFAFVNSKLFRLSHE